MKDIVAKSFPRETFLIFYEMFAISDEGNTFFIYDYTHDYTLSKFSMIKVSQFFIYSISVKVDHIKVKCPPFDTSFRASLRLSPIQETTTQDFANLEFF